MTDKYDIIIIGAGFSGSVLANLFASDGKKVLIIDKRKHIGGNMFDYYDKNGILVHKYGPHILMINHQEVYNYLSNYTEWLSVETNLETFVDGKYIPLPINLNSIKRLYEDKVSTQIIKELLDRYHLEDTINIIDLLNSDSQVIRSFAKSIYDKVFLGYNEKMWGLDPFEIDKEVIGRSPIKISYDNRKSHSLYEVVPKNGYTSMFNNILNHPNISIRLNTEAKEIIEISDNQIVFNNNIFEGKVISTAPIDDLFDYKFGVLPYRALYFRTELKKVSSYYNSVAVTFPMNFKKTRTSEMKKITGQRIDGLTVLVSEYPGTYSLTNEKYRNPSYPILNSSSKKLFQKYRHFANQVENLYLCGRLSEFKYYNMEETILSAFNIFERIKKEEGK